MFAAEDLDNPPREGQTPGIGQAHEQQATVRSGLKFASIGEIKVLRDKKSARCLRRRPYIRVVMPSQPLLPHVIRVVV